MKHNTTDFGTLQAYNTLFSHILQCILPSRIIFCKYIKTNISQTEVMLTATSEGTIFMIPLTKSWELVKSELGPSPSCPCTSTSFPLSSGTKVDCCLSTSGLDGNLGATSTPLISSNFSSNWLEWQWKKGRLGMWTL